MIVVKTVTKSVITRDWNDLEPKLIAFLATGLTATALIQFAGYAGFALTPALASLIVVCVSAIAGYVKKSSQTVPTLS